MIIAITGTPGTGKSELAKRVARKMNYDLIKLNDYVKENKMIIGRDKKRGSDIVDIVALSKARFLGNIIIEGHLSHFIRSDITIVLRCDPIELYKRLKKRGWTKPKIKENLESECLGIILSESLSKSGNVYELDTTKKSLTSSMEGLMEIISGKRNKYKPKINYLERIIELGQIVK